MTQRGITGREVVVFVAAGAILLAAALLSDRLASREGSAAEPSPAVQAIAAHEPAPPIVLRDRFYGLALPGDSVVWLVGNFGKIIRSDDGGASWDVQQSGTSANLQDIAAWDDMHAVAVGNDGLVLRTTDGGATWSSVEAPRSSILNKLLRVKVYPGGRAYAVGAGGMILASEDGGEAWKRLSKREDVAWNDVAFTDAEHGWVAGEFGRILRTEDGGASWRESATPADRSLMAVAFRDTSHGVAVGLDGLIIITDDGGTTWRGVDSGTVVHLYDVAWGRTGWAVSGDGGLLLWGSTSGEEWSVRRLGERELGWHTELSGIGDRWVLAGATQGTWYEGIWSRFAE